MPHGFGSYYVDGVVQNVLPVRLLQAVAGVVGCAELICAAWSIPALLLYFMAVDGRYAAAAAAAAGVTQQQQQHDAGTASINSKHSGSKSRPPRGRSAAEAAAAAAHAAEAAEKDARKLIVAAAVQHWLLVFAAAGLAVLAALSKEIGITITGTMVLYDLLLAPHMLQSSGKVIFSSAAADGGEALSGSKQQQQQRRQRVCRSQVLRVLLLAVVTVSYIKLRSWVAVQQLVDIYRKVRHAVKWVCVVYKDFVLCVAADWRVVCCIAQKQHSAYVVWSFDFAVGICSACQSLCAAACAQRRIRCSGCCRSNSRMHFALPVPLLLHAG
jgi:hypothetical protein